MVDMGTRYGIPTLAVTAVGKDMARDARYWMLDTGYSMLVTCHWFLVAGN